MAKDAKWWRDYRKRKAARKAAAAAAATATPVATPPQPAPPVVAAVAPTVAPTVARRIGAVAPRRRQVRSTEQIRAFVAQSIRGNAANPKGLLNVLCGFIEQIQGDFKLETESIMAERACQHLHPSIAADRVYCGLCHDTEMGVKFGSIPGQPAKPGSDKEPGEFFEEDDLEDFVIGSGRAEDV